MFPSISRIALGSLKNSNFQLLCHIKSSEIRRASKYQSLRYNFASKKKKVIELKTQRIDFESLDSQAKQKAEEEAKRSYIELRQKIETLPWEQMPFDELCSLDQQLIDALEIQMKKDKFNISDQQFLANQLRNGIQIPLTTYQQLDRHYKKIYSLLKNTNDFYDQFPVTEQIKKGYLHQIYITDLKKDKELNQVIARFIKNITKPQKLQAIAEPTFVKYLLSLKRELLLQGIHFETKAEKKEAKEKKQRIIESNKIEFLPKIKILQILNYEYEFWQDVKHNRAKNGSQDNFIIQTKQVANPNQSILLRQMYPTVKIKYIARHKSLKSRERCFCLKADLLIQIDQKMKRRIKVEWKGPSDAKSNQVKAPRKKSQNQNQEEQEEQGPKITKISMMEIPQQDLSFTFDGSIRKDERIQTQDHQPDFHEDSSKTKLNL